MVSREVLAKMVNDGSISFYKDHSYVKIFFRSGFYNVNIETRKERNSVHYLENITFTTCNLDKVIETIESFI
jgi:hypothetical protein